MSTDPLDRAKALMDEGRLQEALALTTPLADHRDPSARALAIHSTILKAMRRREEALVFDERATMRFPNSGVAWHNMAATLGDLGLGAEAVEAMSRGFRLGLDGALSWSVMARARAAAGDLAGAEQAYVELLKRAPQRVESAVEYADLVWMWRGDLAKAQSVLDGCAHAGGEVGPLLIAKAKFFESAGQPDTSAELLAMAAERLPDDIALVMAASQSAMERGRLDEAERLAAKVEARLPDSPGVLNHVAILNLVRGRPDVALAKARKGLDFSPDNQSLWGWAATAARATGDPLYKDLIDYDAMVGVYDIEAPPGWDSLEGYLADLAGALNRIHVYNEHPSAQSLRNGTQTTHRLTGSNEPSIKAFFKAIDKPIRQHMAAMGPGSDPVRSRRTDNYRIEGAWSVRLKPGGYHKDHFHPEGWLSSAFYVETPESALDSAEKQGWIRFGQPPYQAEPPLPAEHFVRPKPGRLVLFPSYMWHGTVPFTTDERRLTIAFDAVPA